MIAGVRHTRHSAPLRATLVRAVGFFLFASAYWGLLPLVARNQVEAGAAIYGILLGAIGAGAVCGAFVLPWLKQYLGPDQTVVAGTIGTAVSLVLFGVAREPGVALAASAIAGISWIVVLASLNVSAQVALPDWVRGRGLAMFVTAFYGAMTLGSMLWGQIAATFGLPSAHFCAAAAALVAIPMTWRAKLQAGVGMDLSPSMHWPTPIVAHEVERDRGPVLVTVEYRIDTRKRDTFLAMLNELANARRRDGAYEWDVFEDAAVEGRFVETFFVASWLEHLRQHQRTTNADRVRQSEVRQFDLDGEPKVSHLIAARSDRSTRASEHRDERS